MSWKENVISALLLTGPYAYGITLLFGVPAYYFLWRYGWLKPSVVMPGGIYLGLLAGLADRWPVCALGHALRPIGTDVGRLFLFDCVSEAGRKSVNDPLGMPAKLGRKRPS